MQAHDCLQYLWLSEELANLQNNLGSIVILSFNNSLSTYLSIDIAMSENTEAHIDSTAMNCDILQ